MRGGFLRKQRDHAEHEDVRDGETHDGFLL
jgi:hypothetical protein